MSYSSFVWLPICGVLTALGLVLSYFAGRRRGVRSMLRGSAWSLLPIAAYLTGSIEMFWKIGAAIGHFADGFAFSTERWAGVAVAGLSALLFFSTGGRRRRKAARLARRSARTDRREAGEATGGTAAVAGARKPGAAADAANWTSDMAPVPAQPQTASATSDKGKTGKSAKRGTAEADTLGDDLKDVENILRKRGI